MNYEQMPEPSPCLQVSLTPKFRSKGNSTRSYVHVPPPSTYPSQLTNLYHNAKQEFSASMMTPVLAQQYHVRSCTESQRAGIRTAPPSGIARSIRLEGLDWSTH